LGVPEAGLNRGRAYGQAHNAHLNDVAASISEGIWQEEQTK
jgi:hypothetical protein